MISEREKLKKELWQQAEKALFALYGETPDARILNRFYREKMIFGETDAIIVWDITADIRLEAKHCGHLTNMTGTDSSCFVAYLMGASDINPLELHYFCPECGKIEFLENKRALPWDIADKPCECGHTMRADGFDIPYEMHIGRMKTHLTVAPPVMEIAENIIKERVRGIYSCISRIRRKSSSSVTFIFGEKHNGNYPGISLVSSAEYDKAKKLTDSTGVDFEEIMMGISGRYLSDQQLVSDVANGKTGGILGFDFNGHPRAKQLKEDLMKASPQSSYDLLKFLGAVHGTRNWLYNANVLVKNGVCKIGDIPSHRDDVFMMLRDEAKIDTGIALTIANKISKGLRSNELTNNERDLIEHLDLPEWFIPYVDKVHYMSSKAATIGVLRIALAFMWYKINYSDKFDI
jgi:DNA polymerase III alpha subunit (gram-positive type)